MAKYFYLGFAVLCVLVVIIAGPQGQRSPGRPIQLFPDMVIQPKIKPQSPSAFFADGQGQRRPVDGTVPLGYDIPGGGSGEGAGAANATRIAGAEHPGVTIEQSAYSGAPDYLNTGRMGDQWGTGFPIPVTAKLMERGRERFGIYCAVCHGATGGGNGVASKYNWPTIANYHDERIVKMADGEIFNTITNGKNTMMGYGANITVADRWAIVAYLRALQRAQRGTANDLPPDQRVSLK